MRWKKLIHAGKCATDLIKNRKAADNQLVINGFLTTVVAPRGIEPLFPG